MGSAEKKISTEEGTGLENVIYTSRFSSEEDQSREIIWRVLCDRFFPKYVNVNDTVLDLGAGDGKFIRHIKAARKIAVDLSPHVKALEKENIEVYQLPAGEMAGALKGQADIVFMSNFLEHLPTKTILLEVLQGVREVLKPGGKVLILQPNVRYVGSAYWDYIDHHIALTEHSLAEALQITGFEVKETIPQFLPYTARSKLGLLSRVLGTELMIKTYLKFPLVWKVLGGQTLMLGKKL